MKIAISILLSTLLFFNSSLFTIIYSIKVIELSFITDFKIRLNEENTDNENFFACGVNLLKLHNGIAGNDNIKWLDDNEFTLNGKYCDVISRRNVNDTVYIFYINDNEEDELNNTAAAHFQKEENKNPEMKYFNILFSFLSNAICTAYAEFCTPSSNNSYTNTGINNLSSNNSDIPSPPPRLIF